MKKYSHRWLKKRSLIMRNIHDFDFHSLSFAKVVDFLTAFRNFVNKRRGDWTDFALPSFCIAACCCYIITCIPPVPVSNEMHINLVTFFPKGSLCCIHTHKKYVEEWNKKYAFSLSAAMYNVTQVWIWCHFGAIWSHLCSINQVVSGS